MEVLTEAINTCSKAGIVLMDLRPSNIMWRVHPDDGLQINLIDFEDVYPQGHVIDKTLIMAQMTDKFCRHNLENHKFDKETHRYFAHVRTNNWTLGQIRSFFESKDGYGSYEKFMQATHKWYYDKMEVTWASFCTTVKGEKDKQVENENKMRKRIAAALAVKAALAAKAAANSTTQVVTASWGI